MYQLPVVYVSALLILMLSISGCSSSQTVTRVTETERSPEGSVESSRTLVDGEEIQSVRSEWEEELLTAQGAAPVLDRYPEASRNLALARRGAIVDAQRNLAQQISAIEITETVTMRDLETSDFVQSRLSAVLRDVEILTESHDEREDMYRVTAQMPKITLFRVVEEYTRRN